MLCCDSLLFNSSDRCISILADPGFAPSAVRCCTALLLLCFLIVGIHASGISIPLSLLMLLGWSFKWIALWPFIFLTYGSPLEVSQPLFEYQKLPMRFHLCKDSNQNCHVFWSWASTLLEFLFHYPCWCS